MDILILCHSQLAPHVQLIILMEMLWVSYCYMATSVVYTVTSSAAEFRKYCKRLHVDLYTKRRRLHAKYSIVHIVFDKYYAI